MNNSIQSRFGTYTLALLTILSAGVLAPACTQTTGDTEEVAVGRVTLALTSTTGTTTYRLTEATFNVDGPVSTVLSSAGDPSLTVLSAELATGNYLSTLQGGWVLEKFNGVAYVPVEAALVSDNPANFAIQDGEVTNLVYQFNTDGTIVSMGTGFLSISIEVSEQETGCVPFGDECGVDAWCAPGSLFGVETDGACLATGTGLQGEACSEIGCALNGVCVDQGDGTPVCIELCPLEDAGLACPNAGVCLDTVSPEFGVCG